MKLSKLNNRSGFTLVELLVVVAIIGILATAGIPQYRRMVQKSKKAEAKVLLGAVANAQAAFNSEFGAYGTNLSAMGMEGGGNANSMIYIGGFPGAGGVGQFTAALPAGSFQTKILDTNPDYYNTFNQATSQVFGRTSRRLCINGARSDSAYTAVACGSIAMGFDLDNGATQDVWTIDENRTLKNTVDGIN